jgi:hypothetical protein
MLWSGRELIRMPNIKPISDLRNYNEVLKGVAMGTPVFFAITKRIREWAPDDEGE